MQSGEADSKPLVALPAVVLDSGIQVQLECWNDEKSAELQQLREEVRMLRVKCQRSSGVTTTFDLVMPIACLVGNSQLLSPF